MLNKCGMCVLRCTLYIRSCWVKGKEWKGWNCDIPRQLKMDWWFGYFRFANEPIVGIVSCEPVCCVTSEPPHCAFSRKAFAWWVFFFFTYFEIFVGFRISPPRVTNVRFGDRFAKCWQHCHSAVSQWRHNLAKFIIFWLLEPLLKSDISINWKVYFPWLQQHLPK